MTALTQPSSSSRPPTPISSNLQVTGMILAGGDSRRMGTNKALLQLQGRTLLEHCLARLRPQTQQQLISTNDPLPCSNNIPQLADFEGSAGPLAGVLAGLQWLHEHHSDDEEHWLLTVAVDTPLFPGNLATTLFRERRAGERILAARSGNRPHPTCALWHSSLLHDMADYLIDQQQRRLMDFLDRQPHRYVDFDTNPIDPFSNCNDPEQFQQLIEQLNRQIA